MLLIVVARKSGVILSRVHSSCKTRALTVSLLITSRRVRYHFWVGLRILLSFLMFPSVQQNTVYNIVPNANRCSVRPKTLRSFAAHSLPVVQPERLFVLKHNEELFNFVKADPRIVVSFRAFETENKRFSLRQLLSWRRLGLPAQHLLHLKTAM